MPRADIPPTPLATPDDCEQQFYEALQQGDLERLMAVWADDEEIACVHPGGRRLMGADAIRAGFAALFRQGGVDAQPDKVRRLSIASGAVHHVLERVQALTTDGPRTAWVISTNVYVQSALGWRMVVHHASPHLVAHAGSASVKGQGSIGVRSGGVITLLDDDDDGPATLH